MLVHRYLSSQASARRGGGDERGCGKDTPSMEKVVLYRMISAVPDPDFTMMDWERLNESRKVT